MLIFPTLSLVSLFYMLSNGSIDPSSESIDVQRVILLSIWMLLSSSPFTAAFFTQLMLEQEQSLFLIYLPDFSLTLFSSWILYVVFSVTMTILMIWLIVFYLNRYER
jgi:hypothetical protein